jgi:tRNA-2-methylthio-N6-dimethylallyladenosine synthase
MQLCDFVKRRNLWGYFARSMSNGITVFQSRVVATICVRLRGTFTRGRETQSRTTKHHEGNSDLWDKGSKRLHLGQNVDSYLWYGGGLKKDSWPLQKCKATAVDFDQH